MWTNRARKVLDLAKAVLASAPRPRTEEPDIGKRGSFRAMMTAAASSVAVVALTQGAQASPREVGGGADLVSRVFASRRQMAGEVVPKTVVSVTTLGYTSPGDGGAATFARASSEPKHPGKVQSADGSWWTQVKDDVDVRQFGAIGDWDQVRHTGTDNTDAIQAAIDFVSFHGGGDIQVGGATYRINRPLVLRHQCGLIGPSDLEGGGGALIVTGNYVFEMPPVGGYTPVSFSLRRVAIVGGVRGATDFLAIPAGGSWGWSTIEGCYICNLRHIDMTVTGVHVLNNNFQNICRIQVRGADALLSGNYANYDDGVNLYSEEDAFFRITAASAIDFSHNYFTSFGSTGKAPRVLDIHNSRQIRVIDNQLDGGDQYNVSISDGAYQVIVTGNRILRYKRNIPILMSNVSDVVINENYIQSLAPNVGFIKFESKLKRLVVRDNLTNARDDDSTHDFVGCPMESDVFLSGPGLSVMHCSQNKTIPSAGFERTYTNLGFSEPVQHFVVDARYVKAGRHLSFVRLDQTRHMVVFDRSIDRTIFDSATHSANGCRLVCYEDGKFTLEL
jgi:hypothetical protein